MRRPCSTLRCLMLPSRCAHPVLLLLMLLSMQAGRLLSWLTLMFTAMSNNYSRALGG